MRPIIFILLIFFPVSILNSQNISEKHLGSWYSYSSKHRLNERISINPYTELRLYEASSNYNLAFASVTGNYHIKNNQTVGLGYAYLDIDTVFEFDNVPNIHEHRIYEQYCYSQKFNRLSLIHRSRLEHRFLNFSNRSEIHNRFRYRLSVKYDISDTFFVLLSDEPFVNFQNQVFHENRFYSGFGIHLQDNLNLQLGYLKQHINKNKLNRIQVGISFQTDARKPKQTIAYQAHK